MMIVSDTTPLNYLVLIGEAQILHGLFGRAIIPQAVMDELQRPETPEAVRDWMRALPPWLEVRSASVVDDTLNLGAGEREAIALAQELQADLILLDDRKARKAARARGLSVTGTLGVLETAAEQGLLSLADAIDRLSRTTFRAPARLIQEMMRRDAERKKDGEQ